jgi:hypothetical protein
MAEQIEDAFENQPLNKAGWLQALDELEREYVAFQISRRTATAQSTGQRTRIEGARTIAKGGREMSAFIVLSLVVPVLMLVCSACIVDTYSRT